MSGLSPGHDPDDAMHRAFAALGAGRGAVPEAAADELIRILPADEAWPAAYAREAARLGRALGGALAVDIAHIGSTAVPGLDAVPVVDVMLGLRGPERAGEIVTVLQTLGYESVGEAGQPGRWLMRYRGAGAHYDAALAARGGAWWTQAIAVRDHLCRDPALARHYAAAKWAEATQGEPRLLGYRRRMRSTLRHVLAGAVPPGPAPSFEPVRLVAPSREHLRAFEAALTGGWSPSSTRDVTAEVLEEIRADPGRYLAEQNGQTAGVVRQPDGTSVPRLPGRVFWIWDSTFCGSINVRYLPGTEELPPHVSGHVGYSVVPAKRNRGYATQALRLVLPVARGFGLSRVRVTCDPGNLASRRVIERNGGVLSGEGQLHGEPKLEFGIPTAP